MIRDGSRVKVTAQLIDGRTDRHLWADIYERELESVLAIQNDVARAIARAVDLTLTPEGERAPRRSHPPCSAGRVRRLRTGPSCVGQAERSRLAGGSSASSSNRSTRSDICPGVRGLGRLLRTAWLRLYISPEDRSRARGRQRAKALELDPTLAEAHASLGFVLMYYDWNFSGAEAEFKRAIELNPNYAIAHQWYAYLLTAMERPVSEAEREIAIARSLDPLSVPINIDRAYILHYYDRNEEALRSVRFALEMNPKFRARVFLAWPHLHVRGPVRGSRGGASEIGPLRNWTPAMAVLGYLYGKSDRPRKRERYRGIRRLGAAGPLRFRIRDGGDLRGPG